MLEAYGAGRFALFFIVQLASVLAPGLVLICELVYIAVALTGPLDRELVTTAEQAVFTGGVPLLVVAALLFAGAILVGYLAREVAFAILLVVERWTTPIGIPQLRCELTRMFGQDVITEVVRRHPAVAPLSPSPAAPSGGTDGSTAGLDGVHLQGWGRDAEATRVFVYSKLWLRSKAPTLSVDQIELEINSVLAMLLPTLSLAVGGVVTLTGPRQIVAALLGAAVAALVWTFILWRAVQLRRAERWEVVRNLVCAHLMEAERPVAATAPEAPEQRVPAARSGAQESAE